MIRVLIIAATAALRSGLRAALDDTEFQITGETATLVNAGAMAAEADVLLFGSEHLLPQCGDVTFPSIPALAVLSDDKTILDAVRELDPPGWAIRSPEASAAELRVALKAAASGLAAIPAAVARSIVGGHHRLEHADDGGVDEPLTQREREVLELVGQGLPNRAIARRLGISEHTAKFHVSSVYGKLGVSSRTEAVRRGVRRGLIEL